MRKLNQKAGFTLAELLIVVAIIAILVAIGIPAFSTAMERSRETVDLANIRGAYAEFMAGTLGGNANTGYYKVNIKQRNFESGKEWVIDCSGFLSNIVVQGTNKQPDKMPASNLKTGDIWVVFQNVGTNEKPSLYYKNYTPNPTSGVSAISGDTVTSGEGWYLGYATTTGY